LPGVTHRSALTVTEISRATGVTKGVASRYLRYYEDRELLLREGRKYSPHDGAKTRAVKLILNLERIDLSALNLGSDLYFQIF
jgi:DNA-binding transcriptional MerR regulator